MVTEKTSEYPMFLGIQFPNIDKFPSWKEKFVGPFGCDYDDEEMYLESKEVFHHEEMCLSFDYKYVITAIQFDDTFHYEVCLVPMPYSLCKEKRKSVCDCCGIDEKELLVRDVYDYGIAVRFGSYDTDDVTTEMPFEEDVINGLAYAVGTADRLRGFYIDKKWNRAGNTGWDTLYNAINNKPMF